MMNKRLLRISFAALVASSQLSISQDAHASAMPTAEATEAGPAEASSSAGAIAAVRASLPADLLKVSATALASQIVYLTDKDSEEYMSASGRLSQLGYESYKEIDNEGLGFRAQAWINPVIKSVIMACRGTDNVPNIFADVGLVSLSGQAGLATTVAQSLRAAWQESDSLIGFGHGIWAAGSSYFWSGLDRVRSASTTEIAAVSAGTIAAGAGAVYIAQNTTEDAVAMAMNIASDAVLGISKGIVKGSEKMLVASCRAAHDFCQTIESEISDEFSFLHTGHSLGGYLASVVANLRHERSEKAITYNAPGGHHAFLEMHGPKILEGFALGTVPISVHALVRESDVVANVDKTTARKTILLPQYSGLLSAQGHGYTKEQHGMDFVIDDLKPLIIEQIQLLNSRETREG